MVAPAKPPTPAMGVKALLKMRPKAEGTEDQVLQWSEDGGALLLHYREAAGQSGYFGYDIASGEVSGVWEMGENG